MKWHTDAWFYVSEDERFWIEQDGAGRWVLADMHNTLSFKNYVGTFRLLRDAKAAAEALSKSDEGVMS